MMAQLLRAVVAGTALAGTGALMGCPDWAASMSYVIGMGVTLMAGTTTPRPPRRSSRPTLAG